MNQMTRRTVLRSAALTAGLARFAQASNPNVKIGVTDWNLRLGAKTEALALAARLGFDGIQISFGRELAGDKLATDDSDLMGRYRQLSAEHKIPLMGTCVDRLHTNGLKNDKLAIKWVQDSIRLTKSLNTKVLLLPFFGQRAMQTPAEMDYVGDVLRDIAPEAEKAGVILALEDTISAENNVRIMERTRSKAVSVYYDTGNSRNNGFDIIKEIRWLGKDRICQIHLKDNPNYMGEGPIDFRQVMRAIKDIGYVGALVLETDTHKDSTVEADMRRNLAFTRKVVEEV